MPSQPQMTSSTNNDSTPSRQQQLHDGVVAFHRRNVERGVAGVHSSSLKVRVENRNAKKCTCFLCVPTTRIIPMADMDAECRRALKCAGHVSGANRGECHCILCPPDKVISVLPVTIASMAKCAGKTLGTGSCSCFLCAPPQVVSLPTFL